MAAEDSRNGELHETVGETLDLAGQSHGSVK
jgi:hypothetical protein